MAGSQLSLCPVARMVARAAMLLAAISHAGIANAGDAQEHANNSVGHVDPFAFVVLGLAFIIVVAMFGHGLAGRFRQPPVLGELIIGVIVGNIGYWAGVPLSVLIMHLDDGRAVFREVWRSGEEIAHVAHQVLGPEAFQDGGIGARLLDIVSGPGGTELVYAAYALSLFSTLGVLLLTFMVGLQSTVAEMEQVGVRAMRVAAVGIVAPFCLGLGISAWIQPDSATPTHLFVAATLSATSVGITARVLMDMHAIRTPEARVILGAAVIDDVLGLLLLAVVAGIAASGEVNSAEIARTSVLSIAFLGAVLLFGERIARAAARVFEYMDRQQGKLLFPIGLAFVLAWAANAAHLAPIVGAFAAGLIIREEYFHKNPRGITIETLVEPLEGIFAPVFFVLIGMQVNLAVFLDPVTLVLAAALTVVAVAGKLAAGGVAGQGLGRLTIGIGMVPRGEVGLIFASVGKGLGVVDDTVFSAIVIMVIVTTFAAPLALRWSVGRAADGAVGPD